MIDHHRPRPRLRSRMKGWKWVYFDNGARISTQEDKYPIPATATDYAFIPAKWNDMIPQDWIKPVSEIRAH